MTWVFGGSMVIAMPVVGLLFVHWAASIATLAAYLALIALLIYSPVRITVTPDGYFDARRPFLPGRDIGTTDELVLEVHASSSSGSFRLCRIESARWRLHEVRQLSENDAAIVERFRSELPPPPTARASVRRSVYRDAG
jgi:hypothetical protein